MASFRLHEAACVHESSSSFSTTTAIFLKQGVHKTSAAVGRLMTFSLDFGNLLTVRLLNRCFVSGYCVEDEGDMRVMMWHVLYNLFVTFINTEKRSDKDNVNESLK